MKQTNLEGILLSVQSRLHTEKSRLNTEKSRLHTEGSYINTDDNQKKGYGSEIKKIIDSTYDFEKEKFSKLERENANAIGGKKTTNTVIRHPSYLSPNYTYETLDTVNSVREIKCMMDFLGKPFLQSLKGGANHFSVGTSNAVLWVDTDKQNISSNQAGSIKGITKKFTQKGGAVNMSNGQIFEADLLNILSFLKQTTRNKIDLRKKEIEEYSRAKLEANPKLADHLTDHFIIERFNLENNLIFLGLVDNIRIQEIKKELDKFGDPFPITILDNYIEKFIKENPIDTSNKKYAEKYAELIINDKKHNLRDTLKKEIKHY